IAHMQIDQHNILWATKEAMLSALRQLQRVPDMLLIDGITALPTAIAQRLIIGGDACCASIAAASILAKVTRDRLMMAYAETYPAYGFDKHKGYPTPEHYARLRTHGPCAIHRVSFRGVLPAAVHGRGEADAELATLERSTWRTNGRAVFTTPRLPYSTPELPLPWWRSRYRGVGWTDTGVHRGQNQRASALWCTTGHGGCA